MKTIFFDVDTQLDFIYPAGALYVPRSEHIVNRLGELTRFARANGLQIISTVDAHTEDDPEFQVWKPHCVAGTDGQKKAAVTLADSPAVLSTRPGAAVDSSASQIIVEKQSIDCFTNPNLRTLLGLLTADRYVVYGVVTEHCVRCAAFGLLATGARVEIVTDAINSLAASDEKNVLARFQAEGGHLTTSARVMS